MSGELSEELGRGVSPARALEIFDSLPAVTVGEMRGQWSGAEVPTGNPLDGLLRAYGWRGKRFGAADGVDPLLFGAPGQTFAVDPAFIPLRLALKLPRLVRHSAVAIPARRILPLLKARRPGARLRMVEYRGVVTATMIYDARPVNDHFRRVDERTLLGAMDLRGLAEPYFFLLRADGYQE